MADEWLNGWKEIADFLGCSTRTAKKYHYQYNMPVYRKMGPVRALKSEINEWIKKIDEKFTKIARKFHHNFTIPARLP